MTIDLNAAWDIATHMTELVAAHGLVEAGKAPLHKGAVVVSEWLRAHLPAADQGKVQAVAQNPASKPAQAALTLRLNDILESQPGLQDELRRLLTEAMAEAGDMTMTVGNESAAIQNRGQNNTNIISGRG